MFPLSQGVEHNVVNKTKIIVPFVLPIRRSAKMNFAFEVFGGQFGFVQRTGGSSGQIPAAQLVGTPRRIALLCQKDFAAGTGLDSVENLKVFLQKPKVNQVTGSR